jgi:hypothetical protein
MKIQKARFENNQDMLTRREMMRVVGGYVPMDPPGVDSRRNSSGGGARISGPSNSPSNDGGLNYGYWPLSSPTGGNAANDANELQYAAQAAWNLGVMAVNGMAWIGNQLPKQGTFHVVK